MTSLRVAVVGSGPAGMYAIQHLLEQTLFEVEIDLFERLPTPWGLVRAGVAPDHPEKKQIADRLFQFYLKRDNVRFFGNVQIGSDISHDELTACYDAIIYAVGASDDKPLAIPGEQLPGSWSARQFVAWYNGHPDCRHLQFDFSSARAVIVGTGNVALDVARILTLPVEQLAKTDVADHALHALQASRLKEVVLLGRRGCQQAAFHNPELEELLHLDGVDVQIQADDLLPPERSDADWDARRKLATLMRLQARRVAAPAKRIVFKFHHSPVAVSGASHVTGVQVQTHTGSGSSGRIDCGLLLRAIGYRGTALAGLPFDVQTGVISNIAGRVMDGARPRTGVYVAGWIKRGPRGVIGTNKQCAAETVECLLADAQAGKLAHRSADTVAQALAVRPQQVVSFRGWQRIDHAERLAGYSQRRPRIKQTDISELLASAGTLSECEDHGNGRSRPNLQRSEP
jgi:ferredoxin/flavodoxin---NADP+ reductase